MPVLPRVDPGLYRCQLLPGDDPVAPRYKLKPSGIARYDLAERNPHFDVKRSEITIYTSDAFAGNMPPLPRKTIDKDGATHYSEAVQFSMSDSTRARWLEEVGELIAAVMFGMKSSDGTSHTWVFVRATGAD